MPGAQSSRPAAAGSDALRDIPPACDCPSSIFFSSAAFFSSVNSVIPSPVKIGVSAGKRSVLFVRVGQLPRCDLAGFHVRLIEGVDAENGTGDGRRELPAEELLAEVVGIVERNAHDRMPGSLQLVQRTCLVPRPAPTAVSNRRRCDRARRCRARRAFRDRWGSVPFHPCPSTLPPAVPARRQDRGCPATRRSSLCRGRTGSRRRRGSCRGGHQGFPQREPTACRHRPSPRSGPGTSPRPRP